MLVSNSTAGTISGVCLEEDGALTLLSVNSFDGKTGPFVIHGEIVYVSVGGDAPALVTCELVGTDLFELSRLRIPAPLTYLIITPDETALLGVSYAQGAGWIWPLEDGRPSPATDEIRHENLHCVVVDDEAHFVSLGEDLIAHYRLESGKLIPAENPVTQLTEGVGARHLILAGENAYLVTEYTGELVRFSREDGRFVLEESTSIVDPSAGLSVSRFGADPKAEPLIWGSDLHLSADGKWLLASERSGSTVASVRLNEDGKFASAAVFSPVDRQPRGFWVNDDGAVLVAGEASGELSSYAVLDDGRLHHFSTVKTAPGPNWVRTSKILDYQVSLRIAADADVARVGRLDTPDEHGLPGAHLAPIAVLRPPAF